MNWLRIICFLFFILPTVYGQGQSIYFRHYEVENGLSHNSVITATQDKEGFMWFGTPDGLNRFDGYAFKIYRSGGAHGLAANAIFYLHEDRRGELWIGTEKGIYSFNARDENFAQMPGTQGKTVRAIQDDPKGNIWFAEDTALYKYQLQTKKIKNYANSQISNISSILCTKNGEIWIGYGDGQLAFYNTAADQFEPQPPFSSNNHSNSIEKLYEGDNGILLVGTSREGLKLFTPATKSWGTAQLTPKYNGKLFVRGILHAKDNDYWIATESGLFIYNIKSNTAKHIQKMSNHPYTLSDNAVYSLCKDIEGGIWVGTYFGGINYYPNTILHFEKYFPTPNKYSIAGNVIREITEDKRHNLWIGTEDKGLIKYNVQSNRFENFVGKNMHPAIASTNIHGLLADERNLYIGTFEHGLYIMDLDKEKIVAHYETDNGGDIKNNYINIIYKTSNGTILICTAMGLYEYHPQTKSFTPLPGIPRQTFYSAILEDSRQRLWLGTHTRGVFFLDKNKRMINLSLKNAAGVDLLRETRILNIFEDKQQQMWICTESGLFMVDIGKKKARLYNTNNGLPGNMVYAILQDEGNNIWATTSMGLLRIDHKTGDTRVFKKTDGLISEQFNHRSAYKDGSGMFYFGSVKGMVKFNPNAYRVSRYTPSIYFTKLQLFNKNIEPQTPGSPLQSSILHAPKIHLNYDQATFSFDFAALSYASPDNLQYAYKLEGLDKHWNFIGQEKRVHFNNLAPGSYTFRVKSTNSSGLWVANEKAIHLEISPPFWQSRTAYGIYFILAGLLFFGTIKFFNDRQKEKQRRKMQLFSLNKEKELNQAKVDFFTTVAHEIRTPLTLIKAPMDKLLKMAHKLPEAERELSVMNKNTERLLALTGQLLNFRRIESGNYTINPAPINIADLAEMTWESFRPIADKKHIDYRFYKNVENIIVEADEDALEKIMSNLLDNALKYGFGRVSCEVGMQSNFGKGIAIFTVKNDGKMIPSEVRARIFEPFFRSKENANISGAGIGLPFARSLAMLHQGSLVYREEAGFNVFTLTLPVASEEMVNTSQ
ncbi:MAG: two-component regulator propeller domain-containing protein [Niabella sp.]